MLVIALSVFLSIPVTVLLHQPIISSLCLLCHSLPPESVFHKLEVCDFLNLTFLRLLLPECSAVMRYSVETCNRLMVHLAALINSYVEVENAQNNVSEVVSSKQRPQITSGACITVKYPSQAAWPRCSFGFACKWLHLNFYNRSNMCVALKWNLWA